jgi:hypothetical protein
MKKVFSVVIALVLVLSFADLAAAVKVIDEEFGVGGSKVQLVKAKVRNGVLTLAVRYIHPWEALSQEERQDLEEKEGEINRLSLRDIDIKFKIQDVYYIAGGKKYKVLKDKEGNWLASPVVGDYIAEPSDAKYYAKNIKKGNIPVLRLTKHDPIKILWFKFPAPPEGVKEIVFQIPEVSPFDVEIKQ